MIETNWQGLQCDAILEEIPCGIMVIDPGLHIVRHNRLFGKVFGESLGKPCYTVIKGEREPCDRCAARDSFADGQQRTHEEVGRDRQGRTINYLAQLTPLRDDSGQVSHVAAITTDLTSTKRLQREYQTLFEKVPCYVTVLNRDRRVVKANEMFRRTFGEPRGEHCFKLFKHRHEECDNCPAALTFTDGESHSARHVGTSKDGRETHYVVSTAPLVRNDQEVTHVIEMCLDVTETTKLEDELVQASRYRKALVEHSLDAIVVTDADDKVMLMNPAAEKLWGQSRDQAIGKKIPAGVLPKGLRQQRAASDEAFLLPDTRLTNVDGEEIPVRLAGMTLYRDERRLGGALIAQDLREIKELEHEKLVAERLAAVGQTVAGLAHGIKNVLMGLEGGMYAFKSGMAKGDDQRMLQGWQMLEENIDRITSFVKEFLEFARGRVPEVQLVDPNRIARQVVELFADKTAMAGIHLEAELQEQVPFALLDAEAIHVCLSNLVSNALDACDLSDKPDRRVTLTTRDADGVLYYEVADNGAGIDYEIRKKVFTTFFSTKGSDKGTGLGLLTTNKIVQEHGGKVSFESTPGEGSIFRLAFPRDRLPEAAGDGESSGGS